MWPLNLALLEIVLYGDLKLFTKNTFLQQVFNRIAYKIMR